MTDVDDAPTDGRNARRERNVNHVLDVVMELFAEDAMFPSMEQTAERSGLSMRSLYRYFADPSELVAAAIERQYAQTIELSHLSSIGEGPIDERIEAFVDMRVDLYERFGPTLRAMLVNAARSEPVQGRLSDRREEMRQQFERQFASELDALSSQQRKAAMIAGDHLCQMESVHLMRTRGSSPTEIKLALRAGLAALLR
ncbi:MAG: TetR/AcrR family transcriptional regulator [Actinomycetota bacterium]